MKIISVGKNTKNAEGIKIPGEVKKAFTKYLKAQQFLHAEEYEKVSVELLFVSWLATFAESEDFKTITEEAEKRKEENKEARKEEQEEKKAAAKQARAEKNAARIKKLEDKLADAKAKAEQEEQKANEEEQKDN